RPETLPALGGGPGRRAPAGADDLPPPGAAAEAGRGLLLPRQPPPGPRQTPRRPPPETAARPARPPGPGRVLHRLGARPPPDPGGPGRRQPAERPGRPARPGRQAAGGLRRGRLLGEERHPPEARDPGGMGERLLPERGAVGPAGAEEAVGAGRPAGGGDLPGEKGPGGGGGAPPDLAHVPGLPGPADAARPGLRADQLTP